MPSRAEYPTWDLQLRSSGNGWTGTFNLLVRTAAADILSDGAIYGPVQIIGDDGLLVEGTLVASDDNSVRLLVEGEKVPQEFEIDGLIAFNA